jgi:hypothetical protein
MKKAIWWLNNLFRSHDFSEFALLGDLRKFHLSELQMKLGGRWKEKITKHTSYQLVNWSNRKSSYSVCYTLQGEFIQIKEELWKNENEISIRPLRKDFEFK